MTQIKSKTGLLMELENLCTLERLDDSEVVNSLEKRYEDSLIYTNCGMILVSINPYKPVDLYSAEVASLYRSGMANLQPHVFMLLEQCLKEQDLYGEHTIIINGDSGSGKTECARHILGYLQIPALKHTDNILESLGNCKTKFNNNSSRFGKLIRLNENVKIQTYLLEKSRVSEHSAGEQNFHIFYYILAKKGEIISNDFIKFPPDENCDISVFLKAYEDLKVSFNQVSIDFELIEKIVLGIVYLGSVIIKNNEIVKTREFNLAVEYLSLRESKLEDFLLRTILKIGNEEIIKANTDKQSLMARNSLARQLYESLFSFVLEKINISLSSVHVPNVKLNILDIFGFENFDTNGLNQFCINWCNERIHHHFVEDTFNYQRNILIQEGVNTENLLKECTISNSSLDLIEMKVGLADLIDEESFINGNANNLQLKIQNYMKLDVTLPNSFEFKHFNGDVIYNLNDFVMKNREKSIIPTSIFNICSSIDYQSKEFFSKLISTTRVSKSLVLEFKSSLDNLFGIARNTRVKYIKCIKPNLNKEANSFDVKTVMLQLRNSGIFQAISLSKHLFPYTLLLSDFQNRYPFSDLSESYLTRGNSYVFFNNNGFLDLEERRAKYVENFKTIFRSFFKIVINKKYYKEIILSLKPMSDENNSFEKLSNSESLRKNESVCIEILKSIESDVLEDIDTVHVAIHRNIFIEPKDENVDLKKLVKDLQEEVELLKQLQKCEISSPLHELSEQAPHPICLGLENDDAVNFLENENFSKIKENFKKVIFSHDLSSEKVSINLIFSSIIDLFIEHTPKYSSASHNADGILCFAQCIFCILSYSRKDQIKNDFQSFMNEWNSKAQTFQRNKSSVMYFLTNIIELKALFNDHIGSSTSDLSISNDSLNFIKQELDLSIANLLDHFVILYNEVVKNTIPYCILDSESLKKERKHLLYFRKLFQGPPISKLIEHLQTLHGMCHYYYIPKEFTMSILSSVLTHIDQICFNSLLIRKKFLDLEKCYQIKYNLSEIEKFCFSIGVRDLYSNLAFICEALKVASALSRIETLNAGPNEHFHEINERISILKIVNESFLNEHQINSIIILFNYETIEKLPCFGLRSKFIPLPAIKIPVTNNLKHISQFAEPSYLPPKDLFKILRFIRD